VVSEKSFVLKEEELPFAGGGRKLPVFVVGPEEGSHPGLILVHEIFGLNDHIRDVSRRFAAQGLRVFAPDLFFGRDGLPEDRNDLDAMRAVWANIPDEELISDLRRLHAFAASRDDVIAETIGAIGYCMGGAIAFMFACSLPHIAFVIDYYGRIRYPQLSANKPRHPIEYLRGNVCPVLGLFSGVDPLIPQEDVDLFHETLKKCSPDLVVKVYPNAPHAFFNDQRENYDKEAADDAWALTLEFIERQVVVKQQ